MRTNPKCHIGDTLASASFWREGRMASKIRSYGQGSQPNHRVSDQPGHSGPDSQPQDHRRYKSARVPGTKSAALSETPGVIPSHRIETLLCFHDLLPVFLRAFFPPTLVPSCTITTNNRLTTHMRLPTHHSTHPSMTPGLNSRTKVSQCLRTPSPALSTANPQHLNTLSTPNTSNNINNILRRILSTTLSHTGQRQHLTRRGEPRSSSVGTTTFQARSVQKTCKVVHFSHRCGENNANPLTPL